MRVFRRDLILNAEVCPVSVSRETGREREGNARSYLLELDPPPPLPPLPVQVKPEPGVWGADQRAGDLDVRESPVLLCSQTDEGIAFWAGHDWRGWTSETGGETSTHDTIDVLTMEISRTPDSSRTCGLSVCDTM